MPIGLENFQPETFEQANPALASYGAVLGMNQISLQNQLLQAQVPYASQLAQGQANTAQAQGTVAQYNAQPSQLPLSQPGITGTLAQLAKAMQQTPQFFPTQAPTSGGTPNIAPPANGVAMPTVTAGGAGYTNPNTMPKLPTPLTAMPNVPPPPVAPAQNAAVPAQLSNIGPQMFAGTFGGPYAEMQKNQAIANNANARTQSLAWQQAPPDQKASWDAYGGGMGITPSKMQDYYNKGYSLSQVAQAEGFDPNNLPTPVYPLSEAGITQMQRRTVADNELQSMNSFIAKGLAPYSQTIGGFSPALISDMAGGKNIDQVENALAAKGMAPELGAMRIRMMNGNVGQGAIEDVTEAAMNNLQNLKVPGFVMTPAIFQGTQQKIQDQLTKAFNAGNLSVTGNPTNQAQAHARQAQMQGQSSFAPTSWVQQNSQLSLTQRRANFQKLPPDQQIAVAQQLRGQ